MKRIGFGVCLAVAFIAAPAMARGGSGGHGGGHSSGGHSSSHSSGVHSVKGYTTKNGTYVAPHMQTNANSTRNDNFSTRGNINPYTGKEGTKPADGEMTPH